VGGIGRVQESPARPAGPRYEQRFLRLVVRSVDGFPDLSARAWLRGTSDKEAAMNLRNTVVLAAALLVVAGVGGAAARAAQSATTVHVTAKDYSFKLSKQTVQPGRITFVIANTGHTSHDFSIAGHHSKTISPGKTTQLTVTLKVGRYPYKCTIDSHAQLGMKGVLHVRS
jgi:plastocyanin